MQDLRSLRHFEAVYRFTSFTAAAEELGLTHSALTKSIKQLEENWQVQLFHRTTRTVAPTEAANKLYPKAVELLAFAQEVQHSITQGEHELRIVCGPGILENLIPSAILRFVERYPKTRLAVSTMPPHLAVEELVQRRIHLLLYHGASLAGVPHHSRLQLRSIVDEAYWMIHRPEHPTAAQAETLADTLELNWAIAGFDELFVRSLPEEMQLVLRQNQIPQYRLLSQSACLDLARQSDIITVLPESAARRVIACDGLEGRPHPGDFRFVVAAAVLRDAGAEPTVEHFVRCL